MFTLKEYFNGCGRRESDFGRDTWYFLHTMAANYPENPGPDQQENMMDMMRIFAQFYPRPNNYFRRR
jgi:FAD-linked sulfhydryl oxidase